MLPVRLVRGSLMHVYELPDALPKNTAKPCIVHELGRDEGREGRRGEGVRVEGEGDSKEGFGEAYRRRGRERSREGDKGER